MGLDKNYQNSVSFAISVKSIIDQYIPHLCPAGPHKSQLQVTYQCQNNCNCLFRTIGSLQHMKKYLSLHLTHIKKKPLFRSVRFDWYLIKSFLKHIQWQLKLIFEHTELWLNKGLKLCISSNCGPNSNSRFLNDNNHFTWKEYILSSFPWQFVQDIFHANVRLPWKMHSWTFIKVVFLFIDSFHEDKWHNIFHIMDRCTDIKIMGR